MAADRSYIERNEAELRRLRAVLEGLSDEQLAQPLDAGWTVGSHLCHMAFWDYRVVDLLEHWGPDGAGPTPTYPSEASIDSMNDAGKAIFLALPPGLTPKIALDAAEAADRAVAAMSDELLAKDQELEWVINPVRADHRREHVDELERLFPPA